MEISAVGAHGTPVDLNCCGDCPCDEFIPTHSGFIICVGCDHREDVGE